MYVAIVLKSKYVASVLWALLRPQTYMLMSIYVLFGIAYGLVSSGITFYDFFNSEWLALISLFAALAFWYIAGTGFNDYADYEIDKINLKKDKQRPLVRGLLGKKELLYYAVFSSVLSFILASGTGNLSILILFGLLLALNLAYSLRPVQLSRRGGLAHLMLPIGYIILTVCSGVLIVYDYFPVEAAVVVIGMYLHFMSRIILKDHRDVVGDAATGKKTLVLKYGNKIVVYMAMALFCISSFLLIYSLWEYIYEARPLAGFLAAGAFMTLLLLKDQNSWGGQKPMITIYGRLCSGFIVVLLIDMISKSFGMTGIQNKFTLFMASTMIFLSIFTIIRIQYPHSRNAD